jgi:arylformamidase
MAVSNRNLQSQISQGGKNENLRPLSRPEQDCSFWPFYPPFEVKYIKRKSEQGVNAQYIQTSNHMGTHLDAPRIS